MSKSQHGNGVLSFERYLLLSYDCVVPTEHVSIVLRAMSRPPPSTRSVVSIVVRLPRISRPSALPLARRLHEFQTLGCRMMDTPISMSRPSFGDQKRGARGPVLVTSSAAYPKAVDWLVLSLPYFMSISPLTLTCVIALLLGL